VTRPRRSPIAAAVSTLVGTVVSMLLPGPLTGVSAAIVTPETLAPSPAVSHEFGTAARTPELTVGRAPTTRYGALEGSGVQVRVGAAGEKRRVVLRVPTRLAGVPAGRAGRTDGPAPLAMATWKVRCVQAETYNRRTGHARSTVPPTRWAYTSRSEAAGSLDWMASLRNVLPGEDHDAVVRATFEFTQPGRYWCFGTWGAQSWSAAPLRLVLARPGTLSVSAPLAHPGSAVQCVWREQRGAGLRPDGCVGGRLDAALERLEPSSAAGPTVNRVEVALPPPVAAQDGPGRWLRAQATFRVTTCSGQQLGVSPCRARDVATGGDRSVFVGSLAVRGVDGAALPSGCVQLAPGDRTWARHVVSRAVHHDEVVVDIRFRVRGSCAQAVRVVSLVRVAAGAPGWVEQDKSHLTVSVAAT